jgi:hypothetical protein
MNTKKVLTILISLALIFTFTPVISFADGYKAVGTGEARPENWVRTREYSRFRKTNYSFEEQTLNGVLADKELEDEINAWVTQTLETTGLEGIYYTAINGYMDVTVGMWIGEIVFVRTEAQNAVWNLKTGERLTEFSDLFYEGTDFVPAVEKAIGGSLDEEPKVFSAAALTMIRYAFDFDPYGGPDINAPLYSMMPAIWDYSPVWNYYDMDHLFKSDMPLNSIADEFTEDISITDRLCIAKIYSPLFLSEEEVEIRNAELQKLYDVILESDEYKNYVQPPMGQAGSRFEQEDYNHYDFPRDISYRDDVGYYVRHFYYHAPDDYVEPIKTRVSFPDNAAKTLIDTPFGVYFSIRETGEIFTPSTHKMLSVNEDFAGLVDIDANGIAEIISVDEKINIYDENMNLFTSIPFKYENFGFLLSWKVIGTNEGEITYITDRLQKSYGVIKYEIDVNGKIHITDEYQITDKPKFVFSARDRKTVFYVGNMLCRDEIDLYDGSAEVDFKFLQSKINTFEVTKTRNYVVISDLQDGQAQNIGVSTKYETVEVVIDYTYSYDYKPSAQITINSTR